MRSLGPRAALTGAALAWLVVTGCSSRSVPGPVPVGPVPDAIATIYLVGDAGNVTRGHPVLEQLTRDVRTVDAASDGRVVVAFLGDNVYEVGVRRNEPGYSRDTLKLSLQVGVLEGTDAEALFLAGNHDWNGGRRGGLAALRAQEAFVRGAAARGARVRFLPPAGCPGPAAVDLPGVRLVLLDTQWFLHDFVRGSAEECGPLDPARVGTAITDSIDAAGDREVIVLSHHPLRSAGPHGGHHPLGSHLFPARDFADWAWVPLPILGTLYVLARKSGITDQDFSGVDYAELRSLLWASFAAARRAPLLHAAGHEHSLQILRGRPEGPPYVLVSGAATKSTAVGRDGDAIFAVAEAGYIRLDVTPSSVRVTLVTVRRGGRAGTDGWCGVIDRRTRDLGACPVR